jgi:hypothetical protein
VNEKRYIAQYSFAHSYENWSPYRYRIPWTIKSILDIKQKKENIAMATAKPFDAPDIQSTWLILRRTRNIAEFKTNFKQRNMPDSIYFEFRFVWSFDWKIASEKEEYVGESQSQLPELQEILASSRTIVRWLSADYWQNNMAHPKPARALYARLLTDPLIVCKIPNSPRDIEQTRTKGKQWTSGKLEHGPHAGFSQRTPRAGAYLDPNIHDTYKPRRG